MLTPDEIRVAIVQQIEILHGSCNQAFAKHQLGVIRGLLLSLTGQLHANVIDASEFMRLAEIPHASKGRTYIVDPEWQVMHGLERELTPWLAESWQSMQEYAAKQ